MRAWVSDAGGPHGIVLPRHGAVFTVARVRCALERSGVQHRLAPEGPHSQPARSIFSGLFKLISANHPAARAELDPCVAAVSDSHLGTFETGATAPARSVSPPAC